MPNITKKRISIEDAKKIFNDYYEKKHSNVSTQNKAKYFDAKFTKKPEYLLIPDNEGTVSGKYNMREGVKTFDVLGVDAPYNKEIIISDTLKIKPLNSDELNRIPKTKGGISYKDKFKNEYNKQFPSNKHLVDEYWGYKYDDEEEDNGVDTEDNNDIYNQFGGVIKIDSDSDSSDEESYEGKNNYYPF